MVTYLAKEQEPLPDGYCPGPAGLWWLGTIVRAQTLVLAALLFALVLVKDTDGSGPGEARLVFWSDRDRPTSGDIFVMDQDGSNLINLTQAKPRGSWTPEVSWDGTRIAFCARNEGTSKIWVMDIDSRNIEMVSDIEKRMLNPSWSPDGTRLAVSADSDLRSEARMCQGMSSECIQDVYVFDLLTKELTRLTRDPRVGHYPAWSPDGTRIAFLKGVVGILEKGDLWIIDADGTNLRQLTSHGECLSKPSWSPDGRQLVYARAEPYQVRVMDVDSGDSMKISDDHMRWPAWSPDGRRIAYKEGDNIWLMNADGTNPIQLTQNSSERMNYQFLSWTAGDVRSVVGNVSWGRLKASVKD